MLKKNEDGIYSISDYYPYRIFDESGYEQRNPMFSKKNGGYILDVKENIDCGIDYYLDILLNELSKKSNIGDFNVITCVPGSSINSISPGLVKIMNGICHQIDNLEYIECLHRFKGIRKLAHGGDRSLEVHANSIIIDNPQLVLNKKIILIDDVTTSGNSLKACTKLLREAGAIGVTCIALGKTI